MLDRTLIRLLSTRKEMELLYSSVPMEALNNNTRVILRIMRAYFHDNPSAEVIQAAEFGTYFALRQPKLKPEQLAVYVDLFKEIGQSVDDVIMSGIRQRLVEARTSTMLLDLVERYESGEADLTAGLRSVYEWNMENMHIVSNDDEVDEDIWDYMNSIQHEEGFRFRLQCLNRVTRPLQGGDFIIIAGRVGVGKTSWLASELTYMAKQVDALYPDEERTILMLNNEGTGERIRLRTYCAALGTNMEGLGKYTSREKLLNDYIEAQGGRRVIRIVDIHDYTSDQIEDLIIRYKPAICVVDMLDNVKYVGGVNNNGERGDQIIEALYARARIWGVKYDTVMMAMSQLSAEAENVMFPTQTMLANSKTGKPGTADLIITISASPEAHMKRSRFIGCPKNKLIRADGIECPRAEVLFDNTTSVYIDPA